MTSGKAQILQRNWIMNGMCAGGRTAHRVLPVASAVVGLLACAAALGQECGQWHPLGAGLGGPDPRVFALAVFDSGMGPEVVAGGMFAQAGSAAANRIARWDGSQWRTLGAGILGQGVIPGGVHALSVHGNRLTAGGVFYYAGGQPATNIAAWDGATWHTLGDGIPAVEWFAGFETYGGELIATGWLDAHGQIARFDGESWLTLGGGFWQPSGSSFASIPVALAVHGGSLYVGGFILALSGSYDRYNLLRWDGSGWHTDVWTGGSVGALMVYNGELVAAENRTLPGSNHITRVHRWDGVAWHILGQDPQAAFNDWTLVLAEYDGMLIAGGRFTMAEGMPANHIARFDGQSWRGMGAGVNGEVRALVVHDGALFAAGNFTEADGQPASRIAVWRDCPPCYANCDGSTAEPILTVDDFTCFINRFAEASTLPHEEQIKHYANCDGSTGAPVLTVDDFTCFINAFAAGCR